MPSIRWTKITDSPRTRGLLKTSRRGLSVNMYDGFENASRWRGYHLVFPQRRAIGLQSLDTANESYRRAQSPLKSLDRMASTALVVRCKGTYTVINQDRLKISSNHVRAIITLRGDGHLFVDVPGAISMHQGRRATGMFSGSCKSICRYDLGNAPFIPPVR